MRLLALTTRHCCQACTIGARRSMASGAFLGYVGADPIVRDADSGAGGWVLTTYWLPETVAAVDRRVELVELHLDGVELERVRRGGWPLAEVA